MKQIFTAVMVWVRNDPHGLLHLNTWSLDHCLERLWAFWDVWPGLLWLSLFLCSCDVPGLSHLHCRIFKTSPLGLGLKMWAERKLSHLSCFCQKFCHNEKSNDSFSHLDTGKRAAPSFCALWLTEMVGHFPLPYMAGPHSLRAEEQEGVMLFRLRRQT